MCLSMLPSCKRLERNTACIIGQERASSTLNEHKSTSCREQAQIYDGFTQEQSKNYIQRRRTIQLEFTKSNNQHNLPDFYQRAPYQKRKSIDLMQSYYLPKQLQMYHRYCRFSSKDHQLSKSLHLNASSSSYICPLTSTSRQPKRKEVDVFIQSNMHAFDYYIVSMEGQLERKANLTIRHPEKHQHTLIWIHGLNQHHEKHLPAILRITKAVDSSLKIVIPRAPDRYVTVMEKDASSWFDIKFRGEKSFTVPFDEAFSSAQVADSWENILKPLIQQESAIVKPLGGKIIVAGFSQGCGMALHSLFNAPEQVDIAIGISGYLFPITHFDLALQNRLHVTYGLADDLRPWEYTKITYEGKIGQNRITMIAGMKHEINKDTEKALESQFQHIFDEVQSKL